MNLQRSSLLVALFVALTACTAESGPRSKESVIKGCLSSDDDGRGCTSTGFEALLPETSDGTLEAACNRYRAMATTCAKDVFGSDACALFAKTERPEMTKVYDCYANLACDADGTACDPPLSTFGDDLASLGNRCHVAADGQTKTNLNLEGAWLRSDAEQAAKDCFAYQDCSDVSECFSAWYGATVYP